MKKNEKPYKGTLTNKIDALFGSPTVPQTPQTLALDEIMLPSYQPRQYFDTTKLAKLADTIGKHGIIEPLLVRPLPERGYELVAGGRRYRAAQIAQLTAAPVIVLNLTDEEALEISILENLQREDLNPVEETEGILRLLASRLQIEPNEVKSLLYRLRNEEKGTVNRNVSVSPEFQTVTDLFTHLGLTWKSFVETRLPLLKLPPEIWQVLQEGKIAYTKALAIARVKAVDSREALLAEAVDQNLSLSQIKQRIEDLKSESSETTTATQKQEFEATTRKLRAAKLWQNPEKWEKAKVLLQQLEDLLDS
ncbi:MAG: ParB/RepB/Spo0J family partition protein [Jaaginema sp. PMC 1079.18]|nr:ParB/RepB/Spo0J family partition protein [Jaaginema sp. PMC 1080.18]MEC4852134.1 ParB/RepB/Spo0J family partition protein [Jaaginema sp. PMC 1079.18]MEC4867658.1 ParB/RepB/Spo0J family partition protein [Jaaginema sp. PMC 1078.18]